MGPLARLTLACGQTLSLTTPCLWLGSSSVLAESSSAFFSVVTLLLILVPMSQESSLRLRAEEGSLLTTKMSRSIITLIMLPFSSWAP